MPRFHATLERTQSASHGVDVMAHWEIQQNGTLPNVWSGSVSVMCPRNGGSGARMLASVPVTLRHGADTMRIPIDYDDCPCANTGACALKTQISSHEFAISTDTPVASIPPLAPKANVTACGDGFASLAWDQSAYAFGVIVRYVIAVRHLPSNTTVMEPQCSGDLHGTVFPLIDGDPYELRVQTVNTVGAGEWSHPISCTPSARVPKVSPGEILAGVAVLVGSQGLAFTLDRVMRRKRPKRRHSPFNAAVFGAIHFASDVYTARHFAMTRGGWGVAFAVVTALGFLVSIALAYRAMQLLVSESPEMFQWVRKHRWAVNVASVLGCVKLSSISVLYSNAFGLSVLSAPVSEALRFRVHGMALLSTVLEDLPQVVITLVIAANDSAGRRQAGVSSAWLELPVVLNILTSGASLLAAATTRVLSLLMVTYGDDKDASGAMARDGSYVALTDKESADGGGGGGGAMSRAVRLITKEGSAEAADEAKA